MIRLRKGPRPEWLERNGSAKTAEYEAAPRSAKPSPWRADGVVNALKEECNGKCMYCEGLIDDVSYSAVEHIRPKVLFPELVLDWDNLGLACTRCNTNKGEYWTDESDLQLINPYADAIENHLQFVGPLVMPVIHSSRGANTIRKLKFKIRTDLALSKMMRIQEIHERIELWADEPNSEIKSLLEEDLREALSPSKEFAATLRAYATTQGFAV